MFTFQSLDAHNLANRKIHSTSFTWRDLLFELLFQMFFFSYLFFPFFISSSVCFGLLLQPISFAFYRLILGFVFVHPHSAHFFLRLALYWRAQHTHAQSDARARAFYIFAFDFGAFNDKMNGWTETSFKPFQCKNALACFLFSCELCVLAKEINHRLRNVFSAFTLILLVDKNCRYTPLRCCKPSLCSTRNYFDGHTSAPFTDSC